MKKQCLTLVLWMAVVWSMHGQIYFARDGQISFFSEAPLEKIEAHNKNATSVVDLGNHKMEFAVLIKAFQFKKALMQQHFNENYLESDQFPKAEFKGQFSGLTAADLEKDGIYSVDVSGTMTIHGVSQEVEAVGTFTVKNGTLQGQSVFDIEVSDYDIKIPTIVREKIAKVVNIKVDVAYQPYETN